MFRFAEAEPSIRAVGPRKPRAIVAGIQTQLVTRAVGARLLSPLANAHSYVVPAYMYTRVLRVNAYVRVAVTMAVVLERSFE